jgi:hypothetical protein
MVPKACPSAVELYSAKSGCPGAPSPEFCYADDEHLRSSNLPRKLVTQSSGSYQ